MTALTRIAAPAVETLPAGVAADGPVDAAVFASLLASGNASSEAGQAEAPAVELEANASAGASELAEQLLPLTDMQRALVPVVLPSPVAPDMEATASPDAVAGVAPTVAQAPPALTSLNPAAPGGPVQGGLETAGEAASAGRSDRPVVAAPIPHDERATVVQPAPDPTTTPPRDPEQGVVEKAPRPARADHMDAAAVAAPVSRYESAESPATTIKAPPAQQDRVGGVRREAGAGQKPPAPVAAKAVLQPAPAQSAAETIFKETTRPLRAAVVAARGGDGAALDPSRLTASPAGPPAALSTIPAPGEQPAVDASVTIRPVASHENLAGSIGVAGGGEALRSPADAGSRPFEPAPVLSLAGQPPVAAEPLRAPAPSLAEALAARTLELARDGAWVEQLARDISRAAAGDGVMRLRLAPETLGELRIEISQSERGLGLRLTTTSEQAQAALAEAQPRLLAEARAQGLRVADAQVDLAGGQQQGREAQRQQQPLPEPAPRIARREPSDQTIGAPARSRADRYA
jgi:flagellar hook-length control protein FliK